MAVRMMSSQLNKIIVMTAIMGGVIMLVITRHNVRKTICRLESDRFCDKQETMKERVIGAISQDDPELIQYIRSYHLWPPSDKPYNFTKKTSEERSDGQAKKIREILKDKKNGFFIECGAFDGEFLTTTLTFEQKFGWQGILIEANPENFQRLKEKNRKAWTSNVCLSIKPYPEKVLFSNDKTVAKIISSQTTDKKQLSTQGVQCFPFYSILLALNRTTIDYLSLDIEGSELDVFKTIPFSKVDIKVMTVEYNHVREGKQALKEFVERNGYKTVGEVTGTYAADFVFVKNNTAL